MSGAGKDTVEGKGGTSYGAERAAALPFKGKTERRAGCLREREAADKMK